MRSLLKGGERSLLKGGVLLFGATLIWQFSNFAFNVISAHELGPEKYGILASVVAFSYLFNPAVLAIQTVASRETTSVMVDEAGSQIRAIVNYYLLRIGLGALALGGVLVVLSPLISRFLHLNSPGLVMIFALVLPTVVASSVVRGVHQGTRRFDRYSLGTATEGLSKVCCVVALLVLVWRNPVSGVLAVLFSALAGLVVNVLLLRHWPKPTWSIRLRRHPIRYSVSTLTVFGLLAVLLSIDTMTARSTLSAHTAGMYAGISLAGKIVYFATTALTTLLFPMFSARFDRGTETARWLAVSMILVAVVSAAVICVFVWAPYLVTTILLGAKYRSAARYLFMMGGIFAIYAMTNLVVMYLLARRQRGIVVPLALAVVVQMGGFAVFHSSIADLMGVMAVAFAVALFGCGILGILGVSQNSVDSKEFGFDFSVDISIRGIHRAPTRKRGVAGGGRHRRDDGGMEPGSVGVLSSATVVVPSLEEGQVSLSPRKMSAAQVQGDWSAH